MARAEDALIRRRLATLLLMRDRWMREHETVREQSPQHARVIEQAITDLEVFILRLGNDTGDRRTN